MAWQYVGGTSAAGTSNGYTVSLTGLTGGLASSPAEGDLVVVFSGFGNTASSAPNITGNNSGAYSPATAAQHVNDTWDTEFRSFYAVMGATPDTSLTVTRATNTAYGGATVVQVWRGVDTANPFIGAATPASGANGAALNPPSYNPAVTDALVIAGGAGTMPAAGTAGYTAITGLSNIVTRYGDGSTSDTSVIMGSVLYAGSAIDPPIATGGTQNNTSSSWAGVNIAFRMQPDPVVHDTTGALTGQIGSVAGSAQHNIPHGTSGDLAGSEAVIVGSADHTGGIVDHATTGALVGDIGSIAGSASSATTRPSSGVLTGPGPTLAGSASRFRALSSTGVLQGQGSTLEGAAARVGAPVSHATTGDLSGTSSALSGSSARVRVMSSSGSLTGTSSTLTGEAQRTGAPVTHDTEGALQGQDSTLTGEASGPVQQRNAGFEMSSRKVYIKRGKRIHIFNTVEDADAWETAEAAAQEAIAKAKTRTAKRRIVRKVDTAIEHEVLRLDLIDALVARFSLKLDLPSIEARQDWAEYVRIAMLARELEDEEEIETLLLWA